MTLTDEQKKVVRNLVIPHIRDLNDGEEFDFGVKCSECTDEEIDILDELCADPKSKTRIGERIWVSVDQLCDDNVNSDCADDLIDYLNHLCADPEVKTRIVDCINRSRDQSLSYEEEMTPISEDIWISVRYSVTNDSYEISGNFK